VRPGGPAPTIGSSFPSAIAAGAVIDARLSVTNRLIALMATLVDSRGGATRICGADRPHIAGAGCLRMRLTASR